MLKQIVDIRNKSEMNTISFLVDFTFIYSSTEYVVQFTQNTTHISAGQIWSSVRI
jgi:hypothetical protein